MHWILVVGFAIMWLPLLLLILGRALGSPEEQSAQAGVETSLDTDSFFLRPRAHERPRTVDDQTVIRLEDYLRAEHEQAMRFVSRPSVKSLYRNCGQGL